MKKLLCAFMSVLLIVTLLMPSLCFAAEEEPFEPHIDIDEYSLTNTITATLGISGGKATVGGRVSAQSTSTHCQMTVQLQKKVNGVWTLAHSWVTSGKTSVSLKKTISVDKGSYRTCVIATLTNGSSTEHPVKYSGTVTAR